MDEQNEMLAQQLKESLEQGGYRTAFGNDTPQEAPADDNPLESDFFKAINAFRAARSTDDKDAIAQAEERLRAVVRGELTGDVG